MPLNVYQGPPNRRRQIQPQANTGVYVVYVNDVPLSGAPVADRHEREWRRVTVELTTGPGAPATADAGVPRSGDAAVAPQRQWRCVADSRNADDSILSGNVAADLWNGAPQPPARRGESSQIDGASFTFYVSRCGLDSFQVSVGPASGTNLPQVTIQVRKESMYATVKWRSAERQAPSA